MSNTTDKIKVITNPNTKAMSDFLMKQRKVNDAIRNFEANQSKGK